MEKPTHGQGCSRTRGGAGVGQARPANGDVGASRRIEFEVPLEADVGAFLTSSLVPVGPAKPLTALVRKNERGLSAAQKEKMILLRQQKQEPTFLMPDAPPQKHKRKESPPRIPCPLTSRNPATPTPRKPQLRQKRRGLATENGNEEVSMVPGILPEPRPGVLPQPSAMQPPVSPKPGTSGLQSPIKDTSQKKKRKMPLYSPSTVIPNTEPQPGPSEQQPPVSPKPGTSGLQSLVKDSSQKKKRKMMLYSPSTVIPNTEPQPGPSEQQPPVSPQPETSGLQSLVKNTSQKKKRKMMYSPSTDVLNTEHIDANDGKSLTLQDDVDIELMKFTSDATPVITILQTPEPVREEECVTEPRLSDLFEEQFLAWEQEIGEDVGSDVEEDALDDAVGISRKRYAMEFPADVEGVSSDLLAQLDELDRREDEALRRMTEDNIHHFNWTSDHHIFKGQREVFLGQASPTFATEGLTPLDIFERFWDEEIIDLIVCETNRYANNLLNNPSIPVNSRLRKWTEVTREEIWTFLGINMFMSLMPIPVVKNYWHPILPYLKFGNIAQFMTYGRYILINKCLHFVNNQAQPQVPSEDRKLQKIMPIINHLNTKFQSLYLPQQEIAIDESLLLWKGRLSFAQMIKTKSARVGIKSYELYESSTGYLWKMIVYTGKKDASSQDPEEDGEPTSATSKIVHNLVEPLLDKGHTLVMDNFYNSPLLSRMLKVRKTDTMGTLRLNREFVPETLKDKNKQNMRTGEVVYTHTEDLTIAVWKDANVVAAISTYHSVEVGGKEKHGQYKYKPNVILDYNLSMGGIDKKDQLLQAYPMERTRINVWYKKLFRRLLNVSVLNSYIIFNSKNKVEYHRGFRLRLMDQIFKKYRPLPDPQVAIRPQGHFPEKSGGKQRCKVCAAHKIESRTTFKCGTCDVSLCIVHCFKAYHLENY